jgi:hypothetical protein
MSSDVAEEKNSGRVLRRLTIRQDICREVEKKGLSPLHNKQYCSGVMRFQPKRFFLFFPGRTFFNKIDLEKTNFRK